MNELKKNTSSYKASLTRRQYLFHEMRTTARLVASGLSIANADKEKIHHLADQMISIDRDDGVKHNYAIFQDVLAKIK